MAKNNKKKTLKNNIKEVAKEYGIGREEKSIQTSIYLESDVLEAFRTFGKEHGKGSRSELVNSLLREKLCSNEKGKNNA